MTSAVRKAFLDQASYCQQLGSPFTATICQLLADRLDERHGSIAQDILAWPGDPAIGGDALALRVAGALHHLAREQRHGGLAAQYPPQQSLDHDALWNCIVDALDSQAASVHDYLSRSPQNNEATRAAALLPAMLIASQRFGLPLALYELGAAAGLNLVIDRYQYRFGDAQWGDRHAQLTLAPEWEGPPPPVAAPFSVVSRQGCDIAPIDVTQLGSQARLLSYQWPDQPQRLQQLAAAMRIAAVNPPRIQPADAANWIESMLDETLTPNAVTVIYHSMLWSQLGADARERIATHLEWLGESATRKAPLVWLRLEVARRGDPATLRMKMWPEGGDSLLARAHPYATRISWVGLDED
jgi:hypothetical protein